MSLLGFGPAELAAISAIMAVATVIQMAVGVGLSLVMIPLLAIVSPSLVPGPAIASAFVVMVAMVRGNSHLIDRAEIGWGAGGLLIGTAIGVLALLAIDPTHLPRLFGGLILLAVGLSLSGLHIALNARNIAITSVISGFMGGMSGIHGPLIGVVYAGQNPAKVRATLGLYWIVAYAMLIAMHVAAGRFGLADLGRAALLVPGILIGTWLSPYAVALMDRERMRIGLLAIAVIGALVLLIRG
ncbi:MAG: sulfite exporter TauE/SafE family protein [Rhizobiales bacterium]|nr:sulfite exporter TauE/SafE family protein [Hyphomicrobiales bacterium]